MYYLLLLLILLYYYYYYSSALKLNDNQTLRRVEAAAKFKAYDTSLDGQVQLSHFHFIFRDLVELKCLSSRLEFSSVVEVLDPGDTGFIGLNDFIRWIESVRIDFIVDWMCCVDN